MPYGQPKMLAIFKNTVLQFITNWKKYSKARETSPKYINSLSSDIMSAD